MMKGYSLDINEVKKLGKHSGRYNFKKQNEELIEEVKIMFEQDKVLDGDKLEELFFPTENYDYFISYSHTDEEIVENLANYLIDKGYKVFLDSKIWGSADALLKLIDDEYCKNENEVSYDYTKRNFSTSHVHSILHSAIGEAINKSENIIFVNGENSLDKNSKELEAKILSPWIYQELKYFNLFYYNQRLISESFGIEKVNDSNKKPLKISRKGDMSNLIPIGIIFLNRIGKKYNLYSGNL